MGLSLGWSLEVVPWGGPKVIPGVCDPGVVPWVVPDVVPGVVPEVVPWGGPNDDSDYDYYFI